MMTNRVLNRTTLVGCLSLWLALGCSGGNTSSDAGGGRTGTGASNGNSGEIGDAGASGNTFGGNDSSGGSGSSATGGASGSSGSSANAGSGGVADLGLCSNGLDDDGDGLIDGFDPECTGALDNDEGTYATGIPGDNRDPKWQDCFFDGNSGAGDDGCRYSTDCLTGDLEPTDPDCELTTECVEMCKPLTPNGCDCFGCCTIQDADGHSADVMIGPTCSADQIQDEQACPPCVKAAACENTCGRCELCPGKTEADLPSDCTPPPSGGGSGGQTGTGGGPGSGGTGSGGTGSGGTNNPPVYTCDGGEQVCTLDQPCPNNYYCQLGCCIAVVR